MVGNQPEVVLDCRNWLGESVIWDDRKAALYWVNIHGKELWRGQPFGGEAPVAGMDEADDQRPISAVYALEADRTVRRLVNGVSCSNSTCWGVDGKTLHFTDMPTRRIDQFNCDAAHGAISNRRICVSFESQHGLADGSVVDCEGCLWDAERGGGKIVRFTPDGQLDREITLPVTNPTCVAFGGTNLDVLFVTTAWFGLTAARRKKEPQAGSLWAFKPGVRGRPENRYSR